MYFVGIDISKFKHDCAVLDEVGSLIKSSWSFANDHEGFSALRGFLNSLEGEKRIGLESTGHYGQNLKLFLESNGFTFMEFNPLLISRFVRSKSLRNTTNDSISAQNIAHYVMTVEYKPFFKGRLSVTAYISWPTTRRRRKSPICVLMSPCANSPVAYSP